MTKVVLITWSVDRIALGRAIDTLIPALNREFLKRNVEAGKVYWSEKHSNYTCYIEVEVGKELGYPIMPSEPPEKQIVLKEAKEDAE